MLVQVEKIHMGKQSNIGPIDPQFGGIAAAAVLDEFHRIFLEIKKDPDKIAIWQFILQKYHPTFILQCENSIAWSKEIITEWLKTGMFADEDEIKKKDKIKNIVDKLSDHKKTKSHGRHISNTEAKKIGLIIENLENDDDLQDLILTVHHAFMHTFENVPCLKIIENHNGVAKILQVNSQPIRC